MDIIHITEAVILNTGIPLAAIKSNSRKREIVQARQIAMYFCREYNCGSLLQIGLYFGGRDHSTVIHACQTVTDHSQIERPYRRRLEEIGILIENLESKLIDPYSFSQLQLTSYLE